MTGTNTPYTDAFIHSRDHILHIWRDLGSLIMDDVAAKLPHVSDTEAMEAKAQRLATLVNNHTDTHAAFKAQDETHRRLLALQVLRCLDEPLVMDTEGDGNAMAVIADMAKQMRRGGWGPTLTSLFATDARNGTYDELLQTVMAWAWDPLDP